MTTHTVIQRWLTAAAMMLVFAGAAVAQEDAAATARRILTETGVQGGLVVHVDCGDGRLTAALRAHEGFLVHGLAAT